MGNNYFSNNRKKNLKFLKLNRKIEKVPCYMCIYNELCNVVKRFLEILNIIYNYFGIGIYFI